jgi:hypothetical protein
MTMKASILALEAGSRQLPSFLWQPRRRPAPADGPEDTPISPRVVYSALVVVSLVLWAALAELVIFVMQLPLFS